MNPEAGQLTSPQNFKQSTYPKMFHSTFLGGGDTGVFDSQMGLQGKKNL
jgi:hypothetical protein